MNERRSGHIPDWSCQGGLERGRKGFKMVHLSQCEGNAADKATVIDYSKTGANKR